MSIQYDMFPPAKKEQYTNQLRMKYQEMDSNTNSVIEVLYKKMPIKTLDPKEAIRIKMCLGGFLGGFMWLLVCTSEMFSCDDEYPWYWNFTWKSFAIYIILGAILFYILAKMIEKKVNRKRKAVQAKVDIEKASNEKKKEEIREKINEAYQNYKVGFERDAKKKSIQYAESTQVDAVVARMMSDIEEIVKKADRGSYIERIVIPIFVWVFQKEIEYSSVDDKKHNKIIFEINRLNDLSECVEQAAMARTIASKIQLKLLESFPQDISGTVPTTPTIRYDYGESCAIAEVTYIAPNGNFKEKVKW